MNKLVVFALFALDKLGDVIFIGAYFNLCFCCCLLGVK